MLPHGYLERATIHPGIVVCEESESRHSVVVKQESHDSIDRALGGYLAACMAGADDAVALRAVRGTKAPKTTVESDWKPRALGPENLFVLPAVEGGKGVVVPNTKRVKFRHASLSTTCTPKYVRPYTPETGHVHTVTPYGICGSSLIPESKVAKRAIQTMADIVVRLARQRFFPTDLKLGNFVWFVTHGPGKKQDVEARLIDLDQIGTKSSGWKAVSFFNELLWIANCQSDLFDMAASHPDIIAVIRQASDSLQGKTPNCTAKIEMHLRMRAIIALMNLQLRAGVEIPLELLVPESEEVVWECYVGGEFFDAFDVL